VSDRIVLHIGAMKTGTTFLQTTLERNNDLLAGAGVDFTGNRFAAQTRAVSAALQGTKERGRRYARWRRLVSIAKEAEQDVSVVSMEFLSFADDRQIRQLLQPLRGMRVEIVMTVRDQFQVAPAQWQTYCRNNGTADWGTYLRQIEPRIGGLPRRNDSYRTFHRAQDVDSTLRRWAEFDRVEKVHVVTVPGRHAPQDELWNRFFDAVGVSPPAVDFGVAAPNTSLGYGSCDLLRRLNRHLDGIPGQRYRKGMRQLAREVLAERRHIESRPALDLRGAEYARQLNRQLRDSIARQGCILHGELEDLPVPASLDGYDRKPVPVSTKETTAAARDAWHYLTERAGTGGRPPQSLDKLVRDDARLLRRVHGWPEAR
jgi:hypothetical protein